MIHRRIHIRNWLVDVFIDNSRHFDVDEVLSLLYDMNASFDTMERAEDMMQGYRPNEAFTYSNGKHTCIYIGWTTSPQEFINSMIHELRHLVDHIAEYYELDNNEAVGYLSGDAAFLLAEDICEHGCPHCGKEKNELQL